MNNALNLILTTRSFNMKLIYYSNLVQIFVLTKIFYQFPNIENIYKVLKKMNHLYAGSLWNKVNLIN